MPLCVHCTWTHDPWLQPSNDNRSRKSDITVSASVGVQDDEGKSTYFTQFRSGPVISLQKKRNKEMDWLPGHNHQLQCPPYLKGHTTIVSRHSS